MLRAKYGKANSVASSGRQRGSPLAHVLQRVADLPCVRVDGRQRRQACTASQIPRISMLVHELNSFLNSAAAVARQQSVK